MNDSPFGRRHGDDPSQDPVNEPDLVDDFFAKHRDAIEPATPNDVHWQQVVQTARRSPMRTAGKAGGGVIAAGVAAMLVLAGVWTWKQEPFGADNIRPGQTVAASEDGSERGTADAGDDMGAAQLPQGVPATFRTWSVSNAGSGTLYNLGTTECGSDICPTLLRSGADGESWQAVHTFNGTDTSSASGADVPNIQPDGALSDVRFVDSQVGYVYGGDLWVTSDRGASFDKVNHPGQTVLDLEIWEGQVYLLTADGCVQGTCSGPVYVSFSSRANPSSFTTVDSAALSGPIDDASVVVKDALVIVQTSNNGRPTQQPWMLAAERLEPMKAPEVCGSSPLEAVTITASTDAHMFALCRLSQDRRAFRVVSSNDQAQSWVEHSVGTLRLPEIGQLSLGAADPQHLVVTVGGPRGGGTSSGDDARRVLQISADGGRSWTVPRFPQPPPVNGFDWTGSPGGAQFYAVPRTTPGFWVSSDFGKSWKVVVPRS